MSGEEAVTTEETTVMAIVVLEIAIAHSIRS
jgi:hypothetical protein